MRGLPRARGGRGNGVSPSAHSRAPLQRRQQSAVHVEDLAVHEVARGRREKDRRAGELFGFAPAAGRRATADPFVEVDVFHERAVQLRHDVAGAEAVALEAVLCSLDGHCAREHF